MEWPGLGTGRSVGYGLSRKRGRRGVLPIERSEIEEKTGMKKRESSYYQIELSIIGRKTSYIGRTQPGPIKLSSISVG
jgi:hypothetical protein